jgi:hypothetical protein
MLGAKDLIRKDADLSDMFIGRSEDFDDSDDDDETKTSKQKASVPATKATDIFGAQAKPNTQQQ